MAKHDVTATNGQEKGKKTRTFKKVCDNTDCIVQRFTHYEGAEPYAVEVTLHKNGRYSLDVYPLGQPDNEDPSKLIPDIYTEYGPRGPEHVRVDGGYHEHLSEEEEKILSQRLAEATSIAAAIQKAFVEPIQDGTFQFSDTITI